MLHTLKSSHSTAETKSETSADQNEQISRSIPVTKGEQAHSLFTALRKRALTLQTNHE
jgi:hypothetical protein